MTQLHESGVLQVLQDALEAQPTPHPLVLKFEHILGKDFVEFTRAESGCDNLRAYIELQYIKQNLQEIANFPEINSKTVIAVGGGFSAGKSSFINSLLANDSAKDQLRLATGTRPVTAVPSYLVHSEEPSEIRGVNYKNARFVIDAQNYEELKHENNQIGAIKLGSAIKYCTVKLKFKDNLLEQCCLIDIPGYNPGSNQVKSNNDNDSDLNIGDDVDLSFLDDDDCISDNNELSLGSLDEPASDYNIARDAIAKADCLIWLFSLEHGPLPANDLEFLKKLGFGGSNNKPLYFVGNKADVRTVEDVRSCLMQTCNTLMEAGISYDGICAYSSTRSCVVVRSKKPNIDVIDFIRTHNHSKDIAKQYDKKLTSIFSIYYKKISSDVDFSQQMLRQIEEIERQGLLDGTFSPGKRSSIQNKIDELKEAFSLHKPTSDLALAHTVQEKFSKCVHDFCSSLDLQESEVKPTKHCVGCGKEIEPDADICPFCYSLQDCSGRRCPDCGGLAAFDSDFCPKCGRDLNV